LGFNPGRIEIFSEDTGKSFNERRLSPIPQDLHRAWRGSSVEFFEPPKPAPQSDRFLVRDAFGGATAVVNGNADPPYVTGRHVGSSYGSYSWLSMLSQDLDIASFERRLNYGLLSGARSQIKTPPKGMEAFAFNDVTVPLGPISEPTSIQRGERHFLGLDGGVFYCGFCHKRGHTSYERYDTVADGSTGAPKRIPTLLGTRLTDPWAWNGHFRDLSEQVRSSIENTMRVKNYTTQQIADITAYLHTLPPPPPLEPATDDPADKEKLARGKELFNNLGCAKCHIPPLTYTSPDTYDVGLEDEKGLKKFNPPSLRGVSQGYSFFHDGRAKTLEGVFTIHGHQLDRDLEKNELADLLRFLGSL
jgi:mono/diheme cytochrome c family protein